MSTKVNKGWLKDNHGDKFAPKTLLSQIVDKDGELLENYIDDALYADIDDNENIKYIKDGDGTFELIESYTVKKELSSFDRAAEPNGTPYNFKQIKVIIKQAKATSSGSAGIACIDSVNNPIYKENFAYTSATTQAFNNQYCTISQYNVKIENGLLIGDAITIATNQENIENIAAYIKGNGYRQGFVCRNVFDISESLPMDRIEFLRYRSLNGYPIPIGTTIDIYAMRFEEDKHLSDNEKLNEILNVFETVTSKNVLNPNNSESGYYEADLTPTANSYRMRTIEPILVPKYKMNLYATINIPKDLDLKDHLMSIIYIDDAGNKIGQTNNRLTGFVNSVWTTGIPTNAKKVHVYISGVQDGITFENICVSFDPITKYEPYFESGELGPLKEKYITIPDNVLENIEGKLSLPRTGNSVSYGTEGQFAVSDGQGGITWMTIPIGEGGSF